MNIVLDIEANGLSPTKIHCVSYMDLDTMVIKTIYSEEEIRQFFGNLSSGDRIIGHNIIDYDIPAVEKIFNLKIVGPAKLDTLALSYALYPKRESQGKKHGLESWGEDFGVRKVKIAPEEWAGPLPGETQEQFNKKMAQRCEQDVKINTKKWLKDIKYLTSIYSGNMSEVYRYIGYLDFKMESLRIASQNPMRLDAVNTMKSLKELEVLIADREDRLSEVMPDNIIYTPRKKPKNLFKQDGTYSHYGKIWYDKVQKYQLPKDTLEFKEKTGVEPPNPSSPSQRKDWLFSLGWTPETFKYNKLKDDTISKVPQVKKDGLLCPSVVRLITKNPAVEVFNKLTIYIHRAGLLKGFLRDSKDGFLRARSNGFTNTLRLRHKEIVNLPRVDKRQEDKYIDGRLIRGMLVAPPNTEFCGADISGLENMVKLHFMQPYDPEYVDLQLTDDFDAHLAFAEFAKALTPEQVAAHKAGTQDYGDVRTAYKTANYAFAYGASPPKISQTIGCSLEQAIAMSNAYKKLNWAAAAFTKNIRRKTINGQMWAYNSVSGFWYFVKAEYKIFNLMCQSTGSYIFDLWLRECLKFPILSRLAGQFHDEGIWIVPLNSREEVQEKLQLAMDKVNEQLKLNVTISMEAAFGDTYADVH